MVKYWTIYPHGVEAGGMPLISCRIAELVDDDGTHYALFGPNGTWQAVVTSSTLPADLPWFKAKLNGTKTEHWYIKIKGIDSATGAMTGTWGHDHYKDHDSDIPPPADPDTWTAQSSSGTVTEDDEPVAASASASSKK